MARARSSPESPAFQSISLLSHMMMAPLSGIVLWCEMLRTRRRLPKTVARAVVAIDRGARAQVAILDNFVELSRAQEGARELVREPVDLAASVRDVIARSGSGANERDVHIRFVPPAAACTVEGDAMRLRTALYNVLENAVRASPPGGAVEIVLEEAAAGVSIRVTDQGAGIPAAARPALFTLPALTEAGPSRRRRVGLGLPVARQIIELHGGTIAVADASPTGCSIAITLGGPAPARGKRRRGATSRCSPRPS